MITLGSMMSGLLVGAGVGLLVLYRVNGNRKENIRITVLLYVIGVIAGAAIDFLGISI
jgi:anaerobic C4-dicarboxylate transporter